MAASIECVVFDIGNVLLRWSPFNLYRRMGFSDAETTAILAETGLPEVNHRVLDAGAPYAETIAGLASRFPGHADFILAFDRRWPETLGGAIEANVAILRALQAAGVATHAISNFSRDKFDIARRAHPFLDEFDELVLSGDVGCVKPDPEIFELLLARRKLDPAACVFIDDNAANIETAQRLGFVTIHYTEHETDLEAELRRLGLR
ncbi:MAG: HAD family phosphatase [Bradyrhizobium sp.]|uniref:HAD family hydrolase n=1 Tax=Bradyrhizobium sp. TaxID=376 RepID=UPI001D88D3A1|nr:HAD family phosphatase [Bradyrhizobium sp.]MBV9560081.1 HAD family phosphatase [Bradyrhizobium sp.]